MQSLYTSSKLGVRRSLTPFWLCQFANCHFANCHISKRKQKKKHSKTITLTRVQTRLCLILTCHLRSVNFAYPSFPMSLLPMVHAPNVHLLRPLRYRSVIREVSLSIETWLTQWHTNFDGRPSGGAPSSLPNNEEKVRFMHDTVLLKWKCHEIPLWFHRDILGNWYSKSAK